MMQSIIQGIYSLLPIPHPVYADTTAATPSSTYGLNHFLGTFGGPVNSNINAVDSIISNAVTIVFVVAGLIAFGIIVFSGFRYLTSQGDQKGVEDAKKTLTSAVIGLIIIILSYFVARLIMAFFGVPFLDFHTIFNNGFNLP